MHGFFINPEHREYVRQRRTWEQSLTQDTYTVEEAGEAIKRHPNTVYGLIRDGKLYAANPGGRATVIPRQAIIDYMVPPRTWQSFLK